MFRPERFTALYGEEQSEEGVRCDPNEMRWSQERREWAIQHLFLMCTPQLDRSELFTELYREEKKEEGGIGGQEDKWEE